MSATSPRSAHGVVQSSPFRRRPPRSGRRGPLAVLLSLLGLALFIGRGTAAPGEAAAANPRVNLAPLAGGETAVSTHAAFSDGDCSLCHQNADPKNPGPVTDLSNNMCLGCHEDFKAVLARTSTHAAAKESCLNCHNPHNSTQPRLLVADSETVCLNCHASIRALVENAAVKHDAVTQGRKCAGCHNPHGANVEHLLIDMPMNLCLNCHGSDDVLDHSGKKLTNMKTLLAENPVHHGPVAAEDCTSCHNPHGFGNFRLLNVEYPPTFYSPYDPKNYGLCFECHEVRAFTEPKTDNLTQFRDGTRNLHFVHVNKSDRGRTCRACHEVHASKQDHHIRDSVPYGSKGWLLKLNYTKTATGGACEKTCHDTKTYSNRLPSTKSSSGQ